MKPELTIKVNPATDRDYVEIEGIKYAGDMFREFGIKETHPGRLLKIINDNGVLRLKVVEDMELAAKFEQAYDKDAGKVQLATQMPRSLLRN